MAKFRKKPIVIEAFKWTADEKQEEDPEWMVEPINNGEVYFLDSGTPVVKMAIKTLEGTMIADRGDWIIKGIKNELYPCKPDIFEATYDKVEENATPIWDTPYVTV